MEPYRPDSALTEVLPVRDVDRVFRYARGVSLLAGFYLLHGASVRLVTSRHATWRARSQSWREWRPNTSDVLSNQEAPLGKGGRGSSSAAWGNKASDEVLGASKSQCSLRRKHGRTSRAYTEPNNLVQSSQILWSRNRDNLPPCRRRRRKEPLGLPRV